MAGAGRIIYAVAIIGFGVLSVGYRDFVNQLEPVPRWLPAYAAIAVTNGALLISLGLGLLTARQVATAARILAGVFIVWIAALQVPSAFADPVLLRSPWWVRTFEVVGLLGGALILTRPGEHGSAVARWGRILYGVSLPVFGTLHVIYVPAALVPPWYLWPVFWAWFTGVAMVAAGIGIVTGRLARLAALLMGVMYATFFVTLHLPRVICRLTMPCEFLGGDPPLRLAGSRPELTSFFVVLGMAGAAWIVAGTLSAGDGTRAELTRRVGP